MANQEQLLILELLELMADERRERQAATVPRETRYKREISALKKQVKEVQRKIDEKPEIDGELWEELSARTEQLETVRRRFKAELEARENFVADWMKKSTFGLREDALEAFEQQRLSIAVASVDALVAEAKKHSLYSSW
jgi:predicted nuclease with TOPRIM domain